MAVGTFVLSAVSACTKVDDTLGQGFIPGGNDKLTLHIDTLGLGEGEAITACQVYYDSIGLAGSTRHTRGAMNLHIAYMGRSSDPVFGKITGASIATCLPSEPLLSIFQMHVQLIIGNLNSRLIELFFNALNNAPPHAPVILRLCPAPAPDDNRAVCQLSHIDRDSVLLYHPGL